MHKLLQSYYIFVYLFENFWFNIYEYSFFRSSVLYLPMS